MKQEKEKKQNNQNGQNNGGKKHYWNHHRRNKNKNPKKAEENKVLNEKTVEKAVETAIPDEDLSFFSDFEDKKPKKEYHQEILKV